MILLLALCADFPPPESADWHLLLQNTFSWQCTAAWLTSGGTPPTLTASGLPLPATGSIPAGLPWSASTVKDPLSSGIWGGGEWTLSVDEGTPRDSQSVSRTGLIQNTAKRSRYFFQLERPLPGGSWTDAGMFRNDSVYLHSVTGGLRNLDFRLMGWEGMGYGWGAWSGWTPGAAVFRAGFSRLYSGDRRPELLAQYTAGLPFGQVTAGAAVAGGDSTVETRFAGGISSNVGSFALHLSGDHGGDGTGWWGGAEWNLGELSFFASHTASPERGSFQSAGLGYRRINLAARFSEESSIALDYSFEKGALRGSASGARYFEADSIHLRSWVLAGFDWYRGRLEAGPRAVSYMNGNGDWTTTLDGVTGFTLGPFAFSLGLEDILHGDSRSWSFGLTWAFIDEPPMPPEEGEHGR